MLLHCRHGSVYFETLYPSLYANPTQKQHPSSADPPICVAAACRFEPASLLVHELCGYRLCFDNFVCGCIECGAEEQFTRRLLSEGLSIANFEVAHNKIES